MCWIILQKSTVRKGNIKENIEKYCKERGYKMSGQVLKDEF